ncbi:MAG TPA: sulfatase-like hydrolase/transferase [Chitinophagaceae bacterium]|nr:sulfatase-like hydrolase/transferase [Chitinophagaceae bacterium]
MSVLKPIASLLLLLVLCCFTSQLCAQTGSPKLPNIILILSDDVGYEVPTVNGGQSYSTPNIDFMAHNGMNFTHCEASPLCSPSRLMLLTGKYSFRNYSAWGWMNTNEKTIGSLMKKAGYKTGFFGKAQLYQIDASVLDNDFTKSLTFEVFDLPKTSDIYRYKNTAFYGNNFNPLPNSFSDNNKYSEDLIAQGVCDFIDSNENNPFFIYYSMSLCHSPLSPTPYDGVSYIDEQPTLNDETQFFPSMVKYMDSKVGQIISKVEADGLASNTIIIFTSDNGTTAGVVSKFNNTTITGRKSVPVEAGTHVPMMIYWPGTITPGSVNDDLVDFTDFFPTLADAVHSINPKSYGTLDGRSFYPRLTGQAGKPRDWIFCHYDPYPTEVGDSLSRWIQNKVYKLYDATSARRPKKFFNLVKDPNEQHPLDDISLTTDEKTIKLYLQSILNTIPGAAEPPLLNNSFVKNITDKTATIGATVVSPGSASTIIERGSVVAPYPSNPGYSFNRLVDNVAATGTFQQQRSLQPQTHYNYNLYARNSNNGNNMGFVQSSTSKSFFTCSAPPLSQPSSFTAIPGTCYVTINWQAAKFPSSGATQGGYLLLYSSTKPPSIIANCNQKPFEQIIASGTIVPLKASVLPDMPAVSATVLNLSPDSVYYFSVIPYTWDGTNYQTYNYLLTPMIETLSIKPLKSTVSLSLTERKLFCSLESNFVLSALALNGVKPYFFSIDSSKYDTLFVFKNLSTGTYTVKVKDSVGCTTSQTIRLVQPLNLRLSDVVIGPSCYESENGVVRVVANGGTMPYKFSFDNMDYDTTTIFKNLGSGIYRIRVKDASGCEVSDSITVVQPQALSLAVSSITNVSCYKGSNGAINFAASGGTRPYRYNINNGSYTSATSIGDLSAGTDTVSVTDNNGCISSQSVVITQPPSLLINSATVQVSCYGGSNGRATIYGSGGIAPYQYSLNTSNYSAEPVFNNLMAGTYVVGVKDATGCVNKSSFIISQPTQLNFNSLEISCIDAINAHLVMRAYGGMPPYLYSFNNSPLDTTANYYWLKEGVYIAIIKDANGCIFSKTGTFSKSNIKCLRINDSFTINIFPNPSGSYFVMVYKTTDIRQPIYLSVVNVYGKRVFSVEVPAGQTYTFGNNLLAGVYMVQVVQGSEIRRMKLIKTK